MNLVEHVGRSIRTRKLFRSGERILVAVSGGVDSMALLHLLQKFAPRSGWKLFVAHFNHHLRGRASDRDEEFVKRAAKRLRLKAIVGRGNVKSFAQQNGLSIEMAARELRHQFLAQTAKELRIRSIALGHHADDQIELFFLRLLRGSGGEGIAGMKWHNPSPAVLNIQLTRPLLDVDKSHLEEFARRNRIGFCKDGTNLSHDFYRNRIRHQLLPLLKLRYQPALARTVSRTVEILRKETEFTTRAADQWLKQKRRRPFAELHVAVQRQCLRLQLTELNLKPDFELIERLRESPGYSMNFSPALSIHRDVSGFIQMRAHSPTAFDPKQVQVNLQSGAGKESFGGVLCRWRIETVKQPPSRLRFSGCEYFDAHQIGSHIVLRHWRAGDRFQPIGMSASVKLQDWFTNQKIPRSRRHRLLVAESASGEVFWVEGSRISERFKLTSHTKRRLVWQWRRSAGNK